MDTRWTFGFNIFDQQQFFNQFICQSRGISFTWGYMFTRYFRMFLDYRLENVGVEAAAGRIFFEVGVLGAFVYRVFGELAQIGFDFFGKVLVLIRHLDDRMFPTRGWFNTASFEIADDFTLSENTYTRYEVASRFYYPIWGPLQPCTPDTG